MKDAKLGTQEEKLMEAATVALKDCMGLKSGESVLVVVDTPQRQVGELFLTAARKLGGEAMLVEMAPRATSGTEPPAVIAEAMKYADVVLIPTSKSLSHTRARHEACRAGSRIASLPGITAEIIARSLAADYERIGRRSEAVAAILTRGNQARITTPAGTDLTMSLAGRTAEPDTGIYRARGSFGNLPAGEAYIAPVEGTAHGLLVVDGSMVGTGLQNSPLRITVENGYATRIEGMPAARLEEAINPLGQPARNIAELGVGTNDQAILTGNVLEDEKVLGTVHVALGNNSNFGGKVQVASHLDGVLLKPTLVVDGEVVIREGKLLIE
ncbi:MAG: aminopeptidase [Syntrophothermus sp.]